MSKASVIVPVYNAEKYLRDCLDSLLAQDYEDYDIWLVDDCGPDGSLAIAEAYAKTHPEKIHLMRNPHNMGQGLSRMRAVAETGAEWIFFVDSDDYVAPDYIKRYISAAGGACDVAIGGYTKDIGGRLKPFSIQKSDYTVLLYSVACCKMYRRTFILEHQIDFSTIRRGEDIYFSLLLFASRPRVVFLDYQGYYYRLNPASTTRSMTHQAGFEHTVMDMFRRFREKADTASLSEEERAKIEYCYLANVVNALVVYGRGCGIRNMTERLQAVREDMSAHYPQALKRPGTGFFRPEGVSLKIRLGVGGYVWSRRLHMEKLLFGLVSLL